MISVLLNICTFISTLVIVGLTETAISVYFFMREKNTVGILLLVVNPIGLAALIICLLDKLKH